MTLIRPSRRDVLKGLGASIALAGMASAENAVSNATPEKGSEATMDIPKPEPRVARYESLAYGMFLHWGLYSQLGRGEWIMHMEKIPPHEYKKLRNTFTASEFNGVAIAQTAKKAGMKYATLTTRHHEGFSLYDTRGLSDYDAVHSPAKRDLVADFVKGCNAMDIKPFFYHTTLDWYQESFEKDFNAYLDYLHQSVEILCTQYGPIGGLWFDGNWSKPEGTDWKEERLYGMIRKHQPEAMIINNTGLHARGAVGNPEIDCVTFEQGHPTPMDRKGMPKYLAAEMCQTMNMHWGIGTKDFCYQSPKEIITNLCACRKVGANYLLNIGPTAEGALPEFETAAVVRTGDWLRMYAEVVYDGKPCGVTSEGKDFALEANGKTYLFVHDLSVSGNAHVTADMQGPGPRKFAGMTKAFSKAEWVDNGEVLKFEHDAASGQLTVETTGFPYGTNTVVRVARLT
ncbi:MAG: alpha-L-fucosidase [Candidatus Hydrogenedentales bacterium]